MLLQVLDDGRLTDGQGRTVDFRNTVLIMTSNIRSAESMREHFRPEFLNRIDEIVEFKALTREQLGEIVELQLERLRGRLAERGLALELTDAAKEALADAGWDPAYGARPLKRAIQRLLENPLALRLLEGDFVAGDTILVDAQDGDLVFTKAGAAAAAAVLELDVVEVLGLAGDGRRAVDEHDDSASASFRSCTPCPARPRRHSPEARRALGRLAEQHGQRPVEDDEDLLLCELPVPHAARVRRQRQSRARDSFRRGRDGQIGSAPGCRPSSAGRSTHA